MSPTIFRESGFRFFFFSREESRMHVHVACQNGEAKFWLSPDIELARNDGLSRPQISQVERLVKEHQNELERGWRAYFGR